MTHITTEADEYPLIRLATNTGVQKVTFVGGEALHSPVHYVVFLNGIVVNYFESNNNKFVIYFR